MDELKLNIFYSNSVDNCTASMLKTIQPNHATEKYIILTPDRRTLITEQELFASNLAKTFFNVNVTTFTRFANETISNHNLNNKKVLTKPSAVAIVKKILLENKNQLKAFSKAVTFEGTASAIFETISMFKSCNVAIDTLQPTFTNIALNNKISDLKLVYEQYENYLQTSYTDSFNKLTLLSTLLPKTNLHNTHFMFIGFDDFTPQTYDILGKLMVHAKSVSVACAAQVGSDRNKNLFTNNIYYNLQDLAKINGVVPNNIACTANYSTDKLLLSKNLFSLQTQAATQKPTQVEVVRFDSKQNELEFVAKTILWNTKNNGKRFQDFAIVVPNITAYESELKTTFAGFNIPTFMDQNQPFADHVLVRFLLHLFETITTNVQVEPLLAMLKTVPTLKSESVFELENLLTQTGLRGKTVLKPLAYDTVTNKDLIKPVYDFLSFVNTYQETTKKEKSVSHFVEELQQFLTQINFDQFVETLLSSYQQNNVVQFKLTTQVTAKMEQSFLDLSELFATYNCTYQEFASILQTYLHNINLSLPPIELDTVFVADSVNSYLPNKKIVFCLGANAGALPVALNDLGIIRDEEINKLEKFAKLTPTVAAINKRNKLLLYEKLLKATEKLFVTYQTVNEKNEQLLESSFVTDILQTYEAFKADTFHVGEVLLHATRDYKTNNQKQNSRLLFNNPNVKSATNNFIRVLKDWYFFHDQQKYLEYVGVLKTALQPSVNVQTLFHNLTFKNKYPNITNAKQLFFGRDTTSVSQFESYFTCPFKHFVEYGLKLQENLTSEIDAREFGNMLHEFVALFMPKLVAKKDSITKPEVVTLANNTFDQVLANPNYELLVKNPYNFFAIKSLKKEGQRIALALYQMEQHSKFVPTKFETRFGKSQQDAITLKTPNGTVYLNGVIDRVDEFENTFRIIDYKSGNAEFSNFTELASGKKIQLFVYLKAEEKHGKTCVGAFYLPLKNDFMKNGKDVQELYKLKGVLANELTTIFAMDDTLQYPSQKSVMLPVQTKADGTFAKISEKYLLTTSDIAWASDYAVTLIKQAYEKMLSGNITPNPLKLNASKTYDQTNLVGLNNFNLEFGNTFRRVNNISNFNKQELLFELNVFSENGNLEFNENFTLTEKQ